MPNFAPETRTKCPYCQTVVKFEAPNISTPQIGRGHIMVISFRTKTPGEDLYTIASFCPNCLKTILILLNEKDEIMIWPLASTKPPAPVEVPQNIAQDYSEASLVHNLSPKASAALSRRCLQTVLRDAGHATKKDLNDQIDEVLPSLPSYIAKNLDAVRNIGNFGAHEQKSKTTGIILDVEPGEAEWNLDVLDSLFDFYYVRPEIERKKREALDQKLLDAGKPPMKTP